MKLGNVTVSEKVVRHQIPFKESLMEEVAKYQEYYRSVYGTDIPLTTLVPEVMKVFLESDKDFKKFKSDSEGNL